LDSVIAIDATRTSVAALIVRERLEACMSRIVTPVEMAQMRQRIIRVDVFSPTVQKGNSVCFGPTKTGRAQVVLPFLLLPREGVCTRRRNSKAYWLWCGVDTDANAIKREHLRVNVKICLNEWVRG